MEVIHVYQIQRVKTEPAEACQTESTEPQLPDLPRDTEVTETIDTRIVPATEQEQSAEEPTAKRITVDSMKKESVFDKVFGDVYIIAVEPAKPPLVLAESEVQQYKECPAVPLGVNPLK